jgi:hypothetical protein
MSEYWYPVLLGLAGRLPDADLATLRRRAAVPAFAEELAAAVPDAAAPGTLDALVDLATAGGPAAVTAAFDVAGLLPDPGYAWEPLRIRAADDPVPRDVSGQDPAGWQDPVATAAVALVRGEPDVRGVWAAVRDGILTVLLVETRTAAVGDLTRRLQTGLAEYRPGVEVYPSGAALPAYHRAAKGEAVLLWAPATTPVPDVVPVFDGLDATGEPYFATDRPRLPHGERAAVAGYLATADAVLVTAATATDAVIPELGAVVPLSYRTDGRYVWPDAVGYYARHHGVAPYGPLLDRIRAAGYRPSMVDGVGLFRAERALFA